MDSNFFTRPFGNRDIHDVTTFGPNTYWDVAGTDIVGILGSDHTGDPITGLAVPEPGTLSLLAVAAVLALNARRAPTRRH